MRVIERIEDGVLIIYIMLDVGSKIFLEMDKLMI